MGHHSQKPGQSKSVSPQTVDVKGKPRGEEDVSSQLGKVTESFRTTVFSPVSKANANDIMVAWRGLNEISK